MPVAVVTGGASGFGLALVERCAALGMGMAVLDLDGERAATEAARVADAHGVPALGMAVDVADAASVDAAAAAVEERFGAVDLVVSNVGVQLLGAVETFADEEWQWLLNVNVTGSARVARAFLRLLRKVERGRLAFTTSSSILDPASRLAAYQASKFAVWGLAETLRLELADDGIGVTVILPSGMITRHLETSEAARGGPLAPPDCQRGRFRRHDRQQPGDDVDARHRRRRGRRSDRSRHGRRALHHHPWRSHRSRDEPIGQADQGGRSVTRRVRGGQCS